MYSDTMASVSVDEDPLSDRMLNDLAKELGDEWQSVGIELGLTHPKLKRMLSDPGSTLVDKIRTMLVEWRQQTPQPDVQILSNALKKNGRMDLAQKLLVNSDDEEEEEGDDDTNVSDLGISQKLFTSPHKKPKGKDEENENSEESDEDEAETLLAETTEDGKYKLSLLVEEYLIPEKDAIIYLPNEEENPQTESLEEENVYVKFIEPQQKFHGKNMPQFFSDVITLEPLGKCLEDYLVVQIPTKKTTVDAILLYNPTGDELNSNWFAIPDVIDTKNQVSYLVQDDKYDYLFTKQLSQFAVGSSDNIPKVTEIEAAVYVTYDKSDSELEFTVAFTCACHENNYGKLESKETKEEFGHLLIKPFSLNVDKSDVKNLQPIKVNISISSPNIDWTMVSNEEEQPCGVLATDCDKQSKLHTVKSCFKHEGEEEEKLTVTVTLAQIETTKKQARVKLSKITEEVLNLNNQKISRNKKRLCLCVLPACTEKRGPSQTKGRGRELFTNEYLTREYHMFYKVLEENSEKFNLLLQVYYKVRMRKTKSQRIETALRLLKNEAKKKKSWEHLLGHLHKMEWQEAVDIFKYVYERHMLLYRCNYLKNVIDFNYIQCDVLASGLVPKDGEKYVRDISVTSK